MKGRVKITAAPLNKKRKWHCMYQSRERDFERNCGKQQQQVLRRRHNVQACTFSQGKSFAKEQQPLIKVLQAKTVFSLVNAVFWEKMAICINMLPGPFFLDNTDKSRQNFF